MPTWTSRAIAAAGFLALYSHCLLAHEGPEHEIEELTEEIKVRGPLPDLLISRAIEYRILGKLNEAAKDLERALDSEETSIIAQRELSQVYFALGKTNEALATVSRSLKLDADDPQQAALLMVRAGILRARRDYSRALSDANEAIQKYPLNVEWYLIRSQLQASLDLKTERLKGLEDGIRETGSGILVGERVDALISIGRHDQASEIIEAELQASRLQASWLIRRAKLRLATGKKTEARTDLAAAVTELNDRLGSGASDALLLADRGLAYDLLGKREDARRDYRAARDRGLTDIWISQRIRALRGANDKDD